MHSKTLKTIFAPKFIQNMILTKYNLKGIDDVILLKSSINDVYKIVTKDLTYIFKIFSINKNIDDIKFELEYMLFLKEKNLLVSCPITSLNDSIIEITYNNEKRFAILTNFIDGNEFTYKNEDINESYFYGKSIAKLHLTSEYFLPKSKIKEINIKTLLIKSSNIVELFLIKYHSNKVDFFKSFVKNIEEKLDLDHLKQCYCHGDLHGGNAKYKNQEVAFFDFEFCGYGYVLYELAIFKWGCMIAKRKNNWMNFIRGYKTILNLHNVDLKYLLHFVAIRHIFVMSLDIERVNIIGHEIIGNNYITKKIKLLDYINTKTNEGME